MGEYPRLLLADQDLYTAPIRDVPCAVRKALREAIPQGAVKKGARIGIAAGSRGVDQVGLVLRSVVEALKEDGAEPFVFPAMGSHGGATDEGQARLLADVFGIDEESMGCPVLSSMKVVELGKTPEHDIPVYIDEHQASADGLLVVNRIKAHTDFHGPYESGLCKMLCIGMGKKAQAEAVHAYGAWGLKHLIPEVAEAKIRMAPVLGGLALLEDGHDQLSEIHGMPAGEILEREPGLLVRAKRFQAMLPFDRLDLLVVDRFSKEISGTGMDTTVIGRRRINNEPEWDRPQVEVLFLRDLDRDSSNNGVGMGLADLITARLQKKIDIAKSQINGLTSTFAQRLMIPVVAKDDREGLDRAMYLLRRKRSSEIRMMRIRDTSNLGRVWISEALLDDARKMPGLRISGQPEEIRFDGEGILQPDEFLQVPTVREKCGVRAGAVARKAA